MSCARSRGARRSRVERPLGRPSRVCPRAGRRFDFAHSGRPAREAIPAPAEARGGSSQLLLLALEIAFQGRFGLLRATAPNSRYRCYAPSPPVRDLELEDAPVRLVGELLEAGGELFCERVDRC